MKETVQKLLHAAVRELLAREAQALPADFKVEVDVSHDAGHGDLTSPVALRLSRILKKSPALIAKELHQILQHGMKSRPEVSRQILRIEMAGPGFLNFFIPSSRLAEILREIHQQNSEYGKSSLGAGKKVFLEFVSANPTGPLTIAHGRQAVLGDALSRILKACGYRVTREYYLNDTGRQIKLLGESLWARYQALFGKEAPLPEEGYQGTYLIEIAEKLKEKKGDSLLKKSTSEVLALCSEFAANEILAGIREDLAAVRAEFDSYFSEKTLREQKKVEETLEALRRKGFIFEEGGALWFRSTQFGDDKDRVLRKQTGEYTYLAPDVAYHKQKMEKNYDLYVNFWGPDHHGYIPRMKAACRALGFDPEKLKILIVQLVTLYRKGEPVRMSTRAGEFVTLRELIDEVGVDATRFFVLLRRVDSPLDFDLDLAKRRSDENPVFYLQYAHARISSIIEFSKMSVKADVNLELLKAPEEIDLIKCLGEFPRSLLQAAQGLEPYRVVEYLRDLAAQFHKFYSAHRVVTENGPLTQARLLLADSVRIVLRNGLDVLGVSAPEKM